MKKIAAIAVLLTLASPLQANASDYSSEEQTYLKIVAHQAELHDNSVAAKIGNSGRLTDGRYLCHWLDNGVSVGNMIDRFSERVNEIQDQQVRFETRQYFSIVAVAAVEHLCLEHKPEFDKYLQDH